jgi:hypothetical protein
MNFEFRETGLPVNLIQSDQMSTMSCMIAGNFGMKLLAINDSLGALGRIDPWMIRKTVVF